jgi:hypothetical protein
MSSGYAHLYINNGVSVNVNDCSFLDGYHGIIITDSISGIRISNCQIQMYNVSGTHGYGIYLSGPTSFTQFDHLTISGYGPSYYSVGIYYASADVSLVSDCYIGEISTANIYVSAGSQITGIKISDCWLDASRSRNYTAGVYIQGTNSAYGLMTITGNTFQGAYGSYYGSYGVYVANGCNIRDVTINNNMFFGQGRHGISVTGGSNFNISSNRILGCSSSSYNTYDGINIDNGVDYLVIDDNTVGHSYGGTSATMRYGISIGNSGSSDYVMVTSNVLTGCVSGSGIYPNSITNKVILANLPDLTGY